MDLFAISSSMRRYLLTIVPLSIVLGVLVNSVSEAGAIGFISSLGVWVLIALCAAVTAGAWLASYLVARAWYVRKRL